jgi:hypothetical protein
MTGRGVWGNKNLEKWKKSRKADRSVPIPYIQPPPPLISAGYFRGNFKNGGRQYGGNLK